MMAAKEAKAAASAEEGKSKKRQRKSVLGESSSDSPNTKKAKVAAYELDKETAQRIDEDAINQKLWETCKDSLKEGKMVNALLCSPVILLIPYIHFTSTNLLTNVYCYRNF